MFFTKESRCEIHFSSNEEFVVIQYLSLFFIREAICLTSLEESAGPVLFSHKKNVYVIMMECLCHHYKNQPVQSCSQTGCRRHHDGMSSRCEKRSDTQKWSVCLEQCVCVYLVEFSPLHSTMWSLIDSFRSCNTPIENLNDVCTPSEGKINTLTDNGTTGCRPITAPRQRSWINTSEAAIVDIQGYWRNGQFVLKTLALLRIPSTVRSSDDFKIQLFSFLPPCDIAELNTCDRRTKQWIEKHHHRVPWHCGNIAYNSRHGVIRRAVDSVSKIYVKGGQKAEWLREYVNCFVIDLDIFQCPPLSQCIKIFREWNCSDVTWHIILSLIEERAIQHVLALIHWISKYRPDLLDNQPVRHTERAHQLPM